MIMSCIAQNRSLFAAIPTSGGAKAPSLPVSKQDADAGGGGGLIRRRLSSLSLNNHVAVSSSSNWSFPRSKSLSSMGDYAGTSLRKWWDWSWAWILSRKPIFATDLEINQHETKLLGSHDRGTWRHVFYRVRSEITRFLTPNPHHLPQTYRQVVHQ